MTTLRKLVLILILMLYVCMLPVAAQAIDPPTLHLEEDTGVPGDGITANGTMLVSGLESGAAWEYSINQGTSWTAGSGASFILADGTYPAGYIRVRQSKGGETSAAAQNSADIIVAGNQITNGDFQSDVYNTGFTTSYSYRNFDIYGQLSESSYAIVERSYDVHGLWTTAFDHTYGTSAGLYFVANGSGYSTDVVWQSTSPITVQAGVAYRFEAYLMSLIGASDIDANYPKVKFQLGDGSTWVDLGTTNVSWEADEAGIWHIIFADGQFSNAGTYYIRLMNMQTNMSGYNDLGVDDIYFGLRGAAPSSADPDTNPTNPAPSFNTDGMLSIALHNDTGASATDKITYDGQVDVSSLSSSTWQYSDDGGISWTNGTGASFTLTGDGDTSVIVRQRNTTDTDWLAPTAPLEFILDTTGPAFSSGTASGSTITLTFGEDINGNSPPSIADFTILLDAAAYSNVLSLNVSGSTVTLTMQDIVENASRIQLNYTKYMSEAAITDIAGNESNPFNLDMFAVKYHANDATSGTTPATQYKNAGTAVTLSGNTGSLLRSGYTYDDWNTEADGGGADYAGGDSYLTDAAMTLFAKWTVNSYTLSYGGNNASGGTPPIGGTYNYAEAVILSNNTGDLFKSGYTFVGWNTTASGNGTTYAAGSQFLMPYYNVTLYAKWELNEIPQTGDTAHGGFWGLLAGFALAAFILLRHYYKKPSPSGS